MEGLISPRARELETSPINGYKGDQELGDDWRRSDTPHLMKDRTDSSLLRSLTQRSFSMTGRINLHGLTRTGLALHHESSGHDHMPCATTTGY